MVRELDIRTAQRIHGQKYPPVPSEKLKGPRTVLAFGEEGYPESLMSINEPPNELFVIGNVDALRDGLAIIGARKATPYGKSSARRFALCAAEHGIPVISGGALGCDSCAHEGALAGGGETVVVLGGGCDQIYPARNLPMFQRVIDQGGAVISERHWDFPPLPYTFRARNRIIAGLARATLIVEAGLPSGTFSTADDALSSNRDVLVIPGPITSPTSRGANRLIYQGATPIVDIETFEDVLVGLYGCMKIEDARPEKDRLVDGITGTSQLQEEDPLFAALCADPMHVEQMLELPLDESELDVGPDKLTWLMMRLATYERDGLIARFPDGRYGPARV